MEEPEPGKLSHSKVTLPGLRNTPLAGVFKVGLDGAVVST